MSKRRKFNHLNENSNPPTFDFFHINGRILIQGIITDFEVRTEIKVSFKI